VSPEAFHLREHGRRGLKPAGLNRPSVEFLDDDAKELPTAFPCTLGIVENSVFISSASP
jgi:hypothetical protein